MLQLGALCAAASAWPVLWNADWPVGGSCPNGAPAGALNALRSAGVTTNAGAIMNGDAVTTISEKHVGLWPRILSDGTHINGGLPQRVNLSAHLARLEAMVDVSKAYIQHGNLHLIRVQKGSVAKVMQDNIPHLFGEGAHWRNSTNFSSRKHCVPYIDSSYPRSSNKRN